MATSVPSARGAAPLNPFAQSELATASAGPNSGNCAPRAHSIVEGMRNLLGRKEIALCALWRGVPPGTLEKTNRLVSQA